MCIAHVSRTCEDFVPEHFAGCRKASQTRAIEGLGIRAYLVSYLLLFVSLIRGTGGRADEQNFWKGGLTNFLTQAARQGALQG